MLKIFFTIISIAVVFSITGCAEKTGNQVKIENPVEQIQNDIVKLKVKPFRIQIVEGYTAKFRVTGINSEGKSESVSASWSLSGDKIDIGSIDSVKADEVTFSAIAPGNLILEAEFNERKASAQIQILKKR